MSTNEQVAFPTEGNAAGPVRASSGQTDKPWWEPWKRGLQLASQLVIASPFGLPIKVVQAAKYLSLALGVWDSLEREGSDEPSTKSAVDAP